MSRFAPSPRQYSHCHFCGTPYANSTWPRRCGGCKNLTYRNPIPVVVLLVPVDEGVIAIRRGVEPAQGRLALPGGYVDFGESWQAAGARELQEETGITIEPSDVRPFDVASGRDGSLLVFGIARRRVTATLPPFEPTPESTERVVLTGPTDLAFSLHTAALRAYFDRARS
jgi:ADP-ribose pyrophosphatase YjhB (NUDIX family)